MASHELASVALDDKYTATEGRIYLSGIQALVRLMLVQKWRDQKAGLNTAGLSRATAARRSAAWTRRCGRRSPNSKPAR